MDGFDSKYEILLGALMGAFDQAANGKGRERHAIDEPFEEQLICYLQRHINGVAGGAIFQVCKKAIESQRLPYPKNVAEMQGAINYAAAAIIEYDRRNRLDQVDGGNLPDAGNIPAEFGGCSCGECTCGKDEVIEAEFICSTEMQKEAWTSIIDAKERN